MLQGVTDASFQRDSQAAPAQRSLLRIPERGAVRYNACDITQYMHITYTALTYFGLQIWLIRLTVEEWLRGVLARVVSHDLFHPVRIPGCTSSYPK